MMARMLYGVHPHDPAVFAAVPLRLSAVAAFAGTSQPAAKHDRDEYPYKSRRIRMRFSTSAIVCAEIVPQYCLNRCFATGRMSSHLTKLSVDSPPSGGLIGTWMY